MASLIISSKSFFHEGVIPARFTCEGIDISPPLSWNGLPENTVSLSLVVDDPDAPDPAAPKMTWVHWILYNIPLGVCNLEEGVSIENLPKGTLQGLNDWHRTGYGGPCPPVGQHRYFFKLYALDIMLPDLIKPTKSQLENAMQGHIIGYAELIGKYQRQGKC
jgi:hypothetical protein